MNAPPEMPTLAQEITASICDVLGVPRPEGARTIEDWEKEVLLYRLNQMMEFQNAALEEKQEEEK